MTASSTDVARPSENTAITAPAFRFGPHDSATSGAGSYQLDVYRNGLKRLFDLLAIIVTVPVTVPLIALLAVLVRLNGDHSFYSQARIGRGGRVYTMWKLRSMVMEADAALDAHLATDPAARTEWDRTQKLKSDPRITRFGRILRKASLDELPQLWNVFKGDMSLVGPRPMLPEQRQLYPGQAYYRLRPGITGMWQVSARNESSFAERAGFDADYDRTVSLGTDLGLLAATVRVVLRGTGH